MNDELEIFFDKSDGCYLESLIRSRVLLSKISEEESLIDKLNEVISIELELALAGSKKALSEVAPPKNNVRPIK